MAEQFVEMQGAARAADLLGTFAGKGLRLAVYKALEKSTRVAQEELADEIYGGFLDPAKFSLVRPGSKRSSVIPTDIEKGGGDVSIGLRVQDKQAQYFHYHLADHTQVRLPGEVGVATKANFIPEENNLYESGILEPTHEGNLPRNALATLRSRNRSKISNDRQAIEKRMKRDPSSEELAKQTRRRKKREAKGKNLKYTGVWFGTIGKATGFWQRLTKANRNGDDQEGHRLRLLVLAAKRSVYKDNRLVHGWNLSMRKGAAAIPELYAQQVDKALKLKG